MGDSPTDMTDNTIPRDAADVGMKIFQAWWDTWDTAIYENGSQGEPEELLAALWDAWTTQVGDGSFRPIVWGNLLKVRALDPPPKLSE